MRIRVRLSTSLLACFVAGILGFSAIGAATTAWSMPAADVILTACTWLDLANAVNNPGAVTITNVTLSGNSTPAGGLENIGTNARL